MLDNDLYKLTQQQAVMALYPFAEVEYKFTNRGGTKFPPRFGYKLTGHINLMQELQLSLGERGFLQRTCPFLSPVYLDLLSVYRYDPREVVVNQVDESLDITIKGPWYRTILWEVPLMALISELYFQELGKEKKIGNQPYLREVRQGNNQKKAKRLREGRCHFAEFGTRRRYSYKNQREVIHDILDVTNATLIGTSNVHLAGEFGIKPIGTMAHEWVMFHAAKYGYEKANIFAAGAWKRIYKDHLSTYLPDTFTSEATFTNVGNRYILREFAAQRQDSGPPKHFARKLVKHYRDEGIDPRTKTITFSDGLNDQDCVALKEYSDELDIPCNFGIGTYLSNDVGVKPLNMVIKMSRACPDIRTDEWKPVVKLSDTKGKHTGDPEEIETCKSILKIEQ